MKDKVIKNLIKAGYNETTVKEMVESQFEYTTNTYPDAKAAKIADIISILWSNS